MVNEVRKYSTTIFIFLICLVFTLLHSNNFFFWDTITEVSLPANFYYDTNFHSSFFNDPKAIGHQTLVPLYLAAVWKIFGKSLLISHLAFFPFVVGLTCLVCRYIRRAGLPQSMSLLILILVILDPALVSQASLLTFDTPQIFFFLLCIAGYSERKNLLLLIAFTGLCLTSLRGVFCGIGLIIYYLIDNYINHRRLKIKDALLFLPGVFSFMIFLWLFLRSKNWSIWDLIVSLWSGSSEFTSFGRLFKSSLIFGWRLVDYGRVGLISVFIFLVFKVIRSKFYYDEFFRQTFLIGLSQIVVFFPVTLIFTKFIGHRYLIPVIIPVAICTGYWILKYSGYPKMIFTIVLTLMISGYFWIYPVKIAQGWDATPAHWPYYKIRNEMISWMKNDSIPIAQTGSFFPNLASFKLTDLSDATLSFKEAELSKDNYVLFSNIFNIPDYKIDELFNDSRWKKIKKIERMNVYMILFKRE